MTSSLCRRKPAVRLVTRRSTACEQETATPSPASGIAERRSLSDTVPERPAMPSSLRASLLGLTGRKWANAGVRLSMTLHSSSSTARLWWWGARESIGACKDVNTDGNRLCGADGRKGAAWLEHEDKTRGLAGRAVANLPTAPYRCGSDSAARADSPA